MTEDQLVEVFRQYLRDRIDDSAGGVQSEFSRKTGIVTPVLSRTLSGDAGVSTGMLLRISNTIGPSISDIYVEIAKRCALAQIDAKVATFPRGGVR